MDVKPEFLLLGAGALVAHHYAKHTELEMPDRAFQVKDVSNHETWIVVLLALALCQSVK